MSTVPVDAAELARLRAVAAKWSRFADAPWAPPDDTPDTATTAPRSPSWRPPVDRGRAAWLVPCRAIGFSGCPAIGIRYDREPLLEELDCGNHSQEGRAAA